MPVPPGPCLCLDVIDPVTRKRVHRTSKDTRDSMQYQSRGNQFKPEQLQLEHCSKPLAPHTTAEDSHKFISNVTSGGLHCKNNHSTKNPLLMNPDPAVSFAERKEQTGVPLLCPSVERPRNIDWTNMNTIENQTRKGNSRYMNRHINDNHIRGSTLGKNELKSSISSQVNGIPSQFGLDTHHAESTGRALNSSPAQYSISRGAEKSRNVNSIPISTMGNGLVGVKVKVTEAEFLMNVQGDGKNERPSGGQRTQILMDHSNLDSSNENDLNGIDGKQILDMFEGLFEGNQEQKSADQERGMDHWLPSSLNNNRMVDGKSKTRENRLVSGTNAYSVGMNNFSETKLEDPEIERHDKSTIIGPVVIPCFPLRLDVDSLVESKLKQAKSELPIDVDNYPMYQSPVDPYAPLSARVEDLLESKLRDTEAELFLKATDKTSQEQKTSDDSQESPGIEGLLEGGGEFYVNIDNSYNNLDNKPARNAPEVDYSQFLYGSLVTTTLKDTEAELSPETDAELEILRQESEFSLSKSDYLIMSKLKDTEAELALEMDEVSSQNEVKIEEEIKLINRKEAVSGEEDRGHSVEPEISNVNIEDGTKKKCDEDTVLSMGSEADNVQLKRETNESSEEDIRLSAESEVNKADLEDELSKSFEDKTSHSVNSEADDLSLQEETSESTEGEAKLSSESEVDKFHLEDESSKSFEDKTSHSVDSEADNLSLYGETSESTEEEAKLSSESEVDKFQLEDESTKSFEDDASFSVASEADNLSRKGDRSESSEEDARLPSESESESESEVDKANVEDEIRKSFADDTSLSVETEANDLCLEGETSERNEEDAKLSVESAVDSVKVEVEKRGEMEGRTSVSVEQESSESSDEESERRPMEVEVDSVNLEVEAKKILQEDTDLIVANETGNLNKAEESSESSEESTTLLVEPEVGVVDLEEEQSKSYEADAVIPVEAESDNNSLEAQSLVGDVKENFSASTQADHENKTGSAHEDPESIEDMGQRSDAFEHDPKHSETDIHEKSEKSLRKGKNKKDIASDEKSEKSSKSKKRRKQKGVASDEKSEKSSKSKKRRKQKGVASDEKSEKSSKSKKQGKETGSVGKKKGKKQKKNENKIKKRRKDGESSKSEFEKDDLEGQTMSESPPKPVDENLKPHETEADILTSELKTTKKEDRKSANDEDKEEASKPKKLKKKDKVKKIKESKSMKKRAQKEEDSSTSSSGSSSESSSEARKKRRNSRPKVTLPGRDTQYWYFMGHDLSVSSEEKTQTFTEVEELDRENKRKENTRLAELKSLGDGLEDVLKAAEMIGEDSKILEADIIQAEEEDPFELVDDFSLGSAADLSKLKKARERQEEASDDESEVDDTPFGEVEQLATEQKKLAGERDTALTSAQEDLADALRFTEAFNMEQADIFKSYDDMDDFVEIGDWSAIVQEPATVISKTDLSEDESDNVSDVSPLSPREREVLHANELKKTEVFALKENLAGMMDFTGILDDEFDGLLSGVDEFKGIGGDGDWLAITDSRALEDSQHEKKKKKKKKKKRKKRTKRVVTKKGHRRRKTKSNKKKKKRKRHKKKRRTPKVEAPVVLPSDVIDMFSESDPWDELSSDDEDDKKTKKNKRVQFETKEDGGAWGMLRNLKKGLHFS